MKNLFFHPEHFMFSLTGKSIGNDTLLLSITNIGVFKGTGHHKPCNSQFYYFSTWPPHDLMKQNILSFHMQSVVIHVLKTLIIQFYNFMNHETVV